MTSTDGFKEFSLDNNFIKRLNADHLRCQANILEYEVKIADLQKEIERVEFNISGQRTRMVECETKINELKNTKEA